MTTLYNIRHDGDQFRISKFVDGEVESSYLTSDRECDCPAGHRHTCRHRSMLPDIMPIANTHWFWDFDRREVVDIAGHTKALLDALALAEPAGPHSELISPPTGVQMFTLDGNPETLFNAIADAVGEPRLPPSPQPFRRRI